ncbi:dodecin family protein [Denitromonas halophila]|uniref:Dodecin domain-containing protein n=1 Tax=Denitromonas halophila TaxID=1629404 RepID=A0A557QXQ2_9RHOO|nr:dodecin family protein [Denitromonas halophila]TVO57698.1 dodecin domain-containing protein [Denitromonas halophila]
MSVARVTEVIAESKKRFDDVMQSGIERANTTQKNVAGARIRDQKRVIGTSKVKACRAPMKVTLCWSTERPLE